MPAVKKFRIDVHATAIFLGCAFQLADGEIAIGVIEDFVT
jgi:hypothetical protein